MSLVHQAQVLNGDAGLLRGSRSSVVRASTAKVGGLGFDSQWLPKFFPSVCFYSDLPPVAYQQFLLPVVVIRIVTKTIMYMYVNTWTVIVRQVSVTGFIDVKKDGLASILQEGTPSHIKERQKLTTGVSVSCLNSLDRCKQ